jgi:uncharacterized membrane protein YidH (DUF202 family)
MHNTQKKIRVSEPVGFFAKLFGGMGRSHKKDLIVAEVRTVKPRKAPIKIEPKVFFSNERTFLAWMHVSVILAGTSVAILALSDYDNIGKQLYGLIMLPVAVAFLVYAMYQCKFRFDAWMDLFVRTCDARIVCVIALFVCLFVRQLFVLTRQTVFFPYVRKSRWPILLSDVKRSYMIRHKLPGPYDDTVGPTILAIMLMVSITAQFSIKFISTNTV